MIALGRVVGEIEDPELGLKFAQFLTERGPDVRLIAAGPLLPPELLMAAIRAGVVDYLQKPVTDADQMPSLYSPPSDAES